MKLLALVLSLVLYAAAQPAYQVSIWLQGASPYSREPTHICNGAIVHQKLILTTAACLHFKLNLSGVIQRVPSRMLYIVVGSNVVRNVSAVETARGFNAITLENDLAILTLNGSLPLADRSDLKWIILSDNDARKGARCRVDLCSTHVAVPNFAQVQYVQILNRTNCSSESQYPATRRLDICSSSVIPRGSFCNVTKRSLELTKDRGSGLVCDNQLLGLFSDVITPKHIDPRNCSDVSRLYVYYTNVSPHLNWIYERIGDETVKEYANPKFQMAVPYNSAAEHAPVMVDPAIIETFTTTQRPAFEAREAKGKSRGSAVYFTHEIMFFLLIVLLN